MNFAHTNCCGMQEITGLSAHKSATEALSAFCKHIFGDIFTERESPFEPARKKKQLTTRNLHMTGTLYSFYLFTAAVYDETTKTKPDGKALYSKPYGSNFAQLLKQHHLGQVSTIRARINHSFHPDHKVQAWLWRPHLRNLKKWWLAELTPKEEAKATNSTPEQPSA